MEDRLTILSDYVTDMLSVEEHILEAVKRQAGTDSVLNYPEANAIIGQIESTVRQHTQRLEAQVDRFGKSADVKARLKNAITETLGVVAGIYNKVRQTDQVSRMLRDDYAAISFAAICYHMLHTTALALKDEEVAQLALDHLNDYSPLVIELSKVVCTVVAQELTDENKAIDPSVAEQAIRNTQEAWSKSNGIAA